MLCCFSAVVWGQREKVKNQPYVDNKLFHLGFHVGIHAQDMLLTHTGVSTNGETWFAEIPTYSPGFSVGVIGDMFLNPYFNLRFIPTINFGDKRFVFREQETGEEFRTSVRSSYLTLPLSVKYSSFLRQRRWAQPSVATALFVFGSSALVASSHRRYFGSVARALAIATLCFCPPDSCAG